MQYVIATILGAVQGFTEFLPISSSGHLLLVGTLLHTNISLAFSILLHVATLAAVIKYSYPTLKEMTKALLYVIRGAHKKEHDTQKKESHMRACTLFISLMLSTLCTAPIGFILKDIVIEAGIEYTRMMFLITAFLMIIPFLIPKIRARISPHIPSNNAIQVSYTQAMLLGVMQGFTVLPGISRSGITITFAVLLGLSYAHATRFSFLMAVPVIFASFMISVMDISSLITPQSILPILLGMGVAFFCGILGLRWLTIIAQKGKIWYFSLYLCALAILLFFIPLSL